jgi:hypothetical protein
LAPGSTAGRERSPHISDILALNFGRESDVRATASILAAAGLLLAAPVLAQPLGVAGEREQAPDPKQGEQVADSDRDLMAAWLKRPDVQAWAKQNGLRVGRVVEVTEQQKADIAAGKIPASTVTKYGMLTDGPDDQKAVNFAYKQMARTPERDLFRASGFTRSGLANTVVEVEIGRDPALYKDPDSGKFYTDSNGEHVKLEDVVGKYTSTIGVRDDGWLGTLPDGSYVWSTDSGKSWAPVTKDVGERLSEGVKSRIDGAVVGLNVTDAPPPSKTYRGVRRPGIINDAAGSVRWMDEETKREEYANPEDIRAVKESD